MLSELLFRGVLGRVLHILFTTQVHVQGQGQRHVQVGIQYITLLRVPPAVRRTTPAARTPADAPHARGLCAWRRRRSGARVRYEHRRPAPSPSLCPLPRRSESSMADEQIPMEQEPSKSEPPETGAGYDDPEEARQPASQPASQPPHRTSRAGSLALRSLTRLVWPMRPGQVRGEGGDGGAEQDESADGTDPDLPRQHRRARAAAGPVCARQGEVAQSARAYRMRLPPSTLPTSSAPPARPTSRARPRPAPRPEHGPSPARAARASPLLPPRLSHAPRLALPPHPHPSPSPLTLTPAPRPTHEPCTHARAYTRALTLEPRIPHPNLGTWYLHTTVHLTASHLHLTPDLHLASYSSHLTPYRPPNPVEFLATYLLQNNPQKE